MKSRTQPELPYTEISGFYQSADDLRLFYRDLQPTRPEGNRIPVLCLPGLTRNSGDFRAIATHLAGSRRVISTDLRGRGRSGHDPSPLNYYPEKYVEDIWQLLATLDLHSVAVIGTSLGGWMAMIMALERPESVVRAVLNDIGPDLNPVGTARLLKTVGRLPDVQSWDEAVQAIKQQSAQIFPDWSDEQWLRFARDTYKETSSGLLTLMLDSNVTNAVRAGTAALRHDAWLLFDALSRIPTLLLHGEESDILSVETIAAMCERKPDLHVVTIPKRGHAPYLDEPEAKDAIDKFISEI